MSNDIIKAIEGAIDCQYHLKRSARSWLLTETEKTIEFRAPSNNSIAFSLDNQSRKPFAFFSKSPPLHWAKICDAFVACSHKNAVYFFIIEVKSAHENEYEKQLINGKLFCDWLLALCREYDYPNAEFLVASVLVWEPRERKRNRKITGERSYPSSDSIEDHDIVEKRRTNHFPFRFHIRNQRQVILRDLISLMNRRSRRQRTSISDNSRSG